MAKFDLKIVRLGAVREEWMPELPLIIPTSEGRRIPLEELFSEASSGRILMRQNTAMANVALHPSLADVSSSELQSMLRTITVNPHGVVPVPRLGLIYAPFYRPNPDVYGLMFDEGIIDRSLASRDPNADSSPREGCAVFIGAIYNEGLRGVDYANQVALTSVHELGHVFNLQHVAEPPCFMNTSKLTAPKPDVFSFTEDHKAHLACVDDRRVSPGGDPFDDSGLLGGADAPKKRRLVDPKALRIKADIYPREFWPWEPIELDVILMRPRARSKKDGAVSIPNRLDPGYRSFEIWIEEPSGERRRYRPARHYCAYPKAFSLAPGEEKRRDISIFSESGGYTFRTAGIHKVWVRFFLSDHKEIVSRPCTVLVKSVAASDSRARRRLRETERLLRIAQHTLYYRSGPRRDDEIRALRELAARHAKDHIGAAASYALGRFWWSHRDGRRAQKHLEKAHDHDELSENRRRNAGRILNQL